MECNLNARALRTLLSSLQNQEDFEEEIKKAAKTTKGETPIPEELHDFRLQFVFFFFFFFFSLSNQHQSDI